MRLDRLIDRLRDEAALYEEFIATLQAETECLVSRDYRKLYDTVCGKEGVLARMCASGQARLKEMEAAAEDLDLSGPVTLTSILRSAEILNWAEIRELKRLRDAASSLIESIKEINKLNSLVAEGSLENINKALALLRGFMPGSTYSSHGAYHGALSGKGQTLIKGA